MSWPQLAYCWARRRPASPAADRYRLPVTKLNSERRERRVGNGRVRGGCDEGHVSLPEQADGGRCSEAAGYRARPGGEHSRQ